MNAKEFIKQYGWDTAKLVISEWNNYFNQYEVIKMPTHYDSDLEIFVHADDFKNLDDSDICIKDLKQLVDAWELIENFGGLFSLVCTIDKECPCPEFGQLEYYDENRNIVLVDMPKIEQAIELVESINE